MPGIPDTLPCRSAGEWTWQSARAYGNPFVDVALDATFTSPSGKDFTLPGFYDGERTWRVRFNANETGRWTFRTYSCPHDPDLTQEGVFEVTAREVRGFLRATPGRGWGFAYESGEPVFLLGDTVYNLFGMAYCGGDTGGFLERRAQQGFNLMRVRLPVSPFHPPDAYSDWQTRRTWPWGGSEQAPQFDRFNLEYFHVVDEVVRQAEQLGVGLEMIMEAWGFEYPFKDRNAFTAEWEQLWMRYLIARYDAFNSVYFWTPMNEYEYYPDGIYHRSRDHVEDRWAMRIGRWIKRVAQHGHVVSVHNGPRMPPFAERFAADPGAVDAIMFQEWGARDQQGGWLAAGIEEQIEQSLRDWPGSAVFAEYGYERNPDLPLKIPSHEFCDAEHTRRGAWRGAFCALGVIHGFENSWGPFMILDEDQPGLAYLLHLRHFLTQVVPFQRMRPAPEIVLPGEVAPGHRPLALATAERDIVALYMPTGGTVALSLLPDRPYRAEWLDPRTGQLRAAEPSGGVEGARFVAPPGQDEKGHPWDWVLVLTEHHG